MTCKVGMQADQQQLVRGTARWGCAGELAVAYHAVGRGCAGVEEMWKGGEQ